MRNFILIALIAFLGTGIARADDGIKRLPPSAFPQLPPSLRQALEERGCLIPQLWAGWLPKRPHNVIRGAFLKKNRIDWAVLCSIGGRSTILVFPKGAAKPAAELASQDDADFVQGVGEGKSGFSRGIGVAGRRHILEFYEAYGGPKPPPLDHQGINDAFAGKASVVRYFYGGEWLELQGAD
jgi:hypothetical protein